MATGPQAPREQVLEVTSGRRRRAEGKPKKNFCCQQCQKAFNSLEKLKVHSYSHTGERPFGCSQPDCSKAFVSKYKLLRHMATHSPEKNHKCSYCEKMFHRKDHLKNHLHTHDPNKEAFCCQQCGKSYNTKLGFKRHLALHAAHSGDLTCQVCLQSLPSTSLLLEHLKSHAGKSSSGTKEKKHRCEHCERRFYTRKDVRRHMVVHTGRKDFLCQYCAQRFGRKDHLTRHVKKSHGRELLRVKSEPTDLLESGVYDPAGTSTRAQPQIAFPGHSLDTEPYPLTTQPFSLKYPLGFTSFSGSSQEHALKGDLDTYLMDLPSSSSAPEPPLPPSSKLELDDPDQESKMSTPTAATAGESLASSLIDFSQLFNFLPLNGPVYSAQAGGSGEASGSYRSSEDPLPLEDAPESADSSLQLPPFMSSLSSAPTLPRFHQAFQ
ncbi:zinc finger protein PLAG1 [Periophthalmus magnuspinnatus]|uniref:zinc finger protein PLAG1 n=1 Tax=Periophthalmus magnuspinnatus TaxID=409849 RepID=UPI00145A2672|nr:zinc finger protein PLAG1 [Periophthalmus magnuspinnatus]